MSLEEVELPEVLVVHVRPPAPDVEAGDVRHVRVHEVRPAHRGGLALVIVVGEAVRLVLPVDVNCVEPAPISIGSADATADVLLTPSIVVNGIRIRCPDSEHNVAI